MAKQTTRASREDNGGPENEWHMACLELVIMMGWYLYKL